MTPISRKFDRASICATCLSQDRKLFPVTEVTACANFYSELSLSQTDKVCWECRHIVRKIVIFKSKVRQAQAWLRAISNSQPSEIPSLSSLDTSTGIFLNVTDPGLTRSKTTPPPLLVSPPPLFVCVKQEVTDEDDIDGDSYDGAKASSSRQNRGVSDRENLKAEFEEEIPVFEISKPKKRKASAPIIIENGTHYTEEELTEEGMLKWWQKKKQMKYYTQTIPIERCDKCAQPFDWPLLLKIHAQKHTELYGDLECNVCTLRMIDERELEWHKKKHYRILKCQYCDFAWDDVNAMRQHLAELHAVRQTVWDCEQCNKQLPSAKKFYSHLRGHRRAKCPECGKSFSELYIGNHMIQHRGGKPLVTCDQCGRSFRGEEGLKTHLETHSTEVHPEAYCKECDIHFRNMMLYRIHMKSNKHATEADYTHKCKECDKKFVKWSSLKSHMAVHGDARYPCDQCDQSYTKKSGLRSHVMWKHERRERPRDKLCDHCGRGFATKSMLSSHMNTHTGARPFVCKLCGADFGHKSALYLHGRYKHKIPKKKTKKDKEKTDKKNIGGTDNSGEDGGKDV